MNPLLNYGFNPERIPNDSTGIPARVTAVHKDRYQLICEHGEIYGRLKTKTYYAGSEAFPTTGDFVMIQYISTGDSLILKTLPRTSKFSRNDFSGHAAGYVKTIKEQVVAANFDYVFIMQSLNNDFNLKRLNRYITLAYQSGATPVVILTKADLVNDDLIAEHKEAISISAIGIDICVVSARNGYGIDALSEYLKPGKTIVFLGSSGVGKSSLVNALAEEDIMAVNDIRLDDSKGRHTTTHRQLIKLKSGVMIIDTPGMRELGMWDVSTGLSEAFADIEGLMDQCKFADCSHASEPGCAISAAISQGELSTDRWESYLQITREVKFVDEKSTALRQKEAWQKEIAKFSKQLKKQGGKR